MLAGSRNALCPCNGHLQLPPILLGGTLAALGIRKLPMLYALGIRRRPLGGTLAALADPSPADDVRGPAARKPGSRSLQHCGAPARGVCGNPASPGPLGRSAKTERGAPGAGKGLTQRCLAPSLGLHRSPSRRTLSRTPSRVGGQAGPVGPRFAVIAAGPR
jgi:hypothetical protein